MFRDYQATDIIEQQNKSCNLLFLYAGPWLTVLVGSLGGLGSKLSSELVIEPSLDIGSIFEERSSWESIPSSFRNLLNIIGSMIGSDSKFPRKGLQCLTATCHV